jgi:hypothetical protein
VKRIVLTFAITLLAALSGAVRAEPYLAVRQGLKCAACHQNPTGGGMRTALGNSWAQNVLAEHRLDIPGIGPWMGSIGRYLSLGGDLRTGESDTDLPHQPSVKDSGIQEGRVYVQLTCSPTGSSSISTSGSRQATTSDSSPTPSCGCGTVRST